MKDPTDWKQKWTNNETRFHQSTVHPELVKFMPLLPPGTVFVPLCGKSLDMLFLAEHGQKVLGVELSPVACQAFFAENKIAHQVDTVGEFAVYSSESITLWCGDYFKLPGTVWDAITGIYDRAAIVALPAELRTAYAREMRTRAPKGTTLLLISYDYPENTFNGPPFSVIEAEMRRHFDGCELEVLSAQSSDVRGVMVQDKTYCIRLR